MSSKEWILQYAENESESEDSLDETEDSNNDPVSFVIVSFILNTVKLIIFTLLLFAIPSAPFGCIILWQNHVDEILEWLQQFFPVCLGFLW